MLGMIIYGLIWCFAIYGILVMLQDITRKTTYRKIEENVKLIMTVKDAEDGIENYIRELNSLIYLARGKLKSFLLD